MIHLEGCPVDQVRPYGPYGGADKYDTLAAFYPGKFDEASAALAAMVSVAVRNPVATRDDMRRAAPLGRSK